MNIFKSLYQKITIEEIYHWIEFGFKTLLEDGSKVISSFIKCGYIEPEQDIDELSRGLDAIEIENEGHSEENVMEVENEGSSDGDFCVDGIEYNDDNAEHSDFEA